MTQLVAEYQEKFESVVSRLHLSKEYKISCFLSGLKHDIQMMVRMFQPTTFLKAAQLAKLYESAATSGSPPKQFLKFPKNSVVTKPLLSLPSSIKGDFTSTENRTQLNPQLYRSLTPAFMSERRSKGLCYFCDEPFTLAHALTHKKLEIHVLEVNDDRSSDLEEEDSPQNFLTDPGQSLDPHIFVHVLTGVANF